MRNQRLERVLAERALGIARPRAITFAADLLIHAPAAACDRPSLGIEDRFQIVPMVVGERVNDELHGFFCRAGASCRIPCGHVPIRSWSLFKARDVMRGVIESFKAENSL